MSKTVKKNAAASALGKLRAKKLGKRRTAEIARDAANARWERVRSGQAEINAKEKS